MTEKSEEREGVAEGASEGLADLDVPEAQADEVRGGTMPPGNEDEWMDDLEIQR